MLAAGRARAPKAAWQTAFGAWYFVGADRSQKLSATGTRAARVTPEWASSVPRWPVGNVGNVGGVGGVGTRRRVTVPAGRAAVGLRHRRRLRLRHWVPSWAPR